jgi:hypothetical protein
VLSRRGLIPSQALQLGNCADHHRELMPNPYTSTSYCGTSAEHPASSQQLSECSYRPQSFGCTRCTRVPQSSRRVSADCSGYCMIGHRLAATHKAMQAAGFIAIQGSVRSWSTAGVLSAIRLQAQGSHTRHDRASRAAVRRVLLPPARLRLSCLGLASGTRRGHAASNWAGSCPGNNLPVG